MLGADASRMGLPANDGGNVNWTNERPTVEGWYWLRLPNAETTNLVWVEHTMGEGWSARMAGVPGDQSLVGLPPIVQWFGPISPPQPASMADQIKFAIENAERLLAEQGVQCVRRLGDQWVIETGEPRTVMADSIYEAFLRVRKQG